MLLLYRVLSASVQCPKGQQHIVQDSVKFCHEARQQGHQVVISRLEGNSITPSIVSSEGWIHCRDNAEIKDRLTNTIDRQEDVQLHLMAWSDVMCPPIPLTGPEILLPPATDHMELDVNQAKVPHSTREDAYPNYLKLWKPSLYLEMRTEDSIYLWPLFRRK